MAWVLGHLDDLASDFSAIHRVGDIAALPSRVFFALAPRLAAYQGVMRATVISEAAAAEAAGASGPQRPPGGREMVGGTRAELEATPEFAGVFSFG